MKNITFYLILLFTSSLLFQGCNSCNKTKENFEELTLADASVVWWMAPGIIAQKDSLYEKTGLNVKSFDVQTGLASKNAVLSGSADIGLVASTPLAMGAFNKDNLVILCSYVESNSLLTLITHNDTTLFTLPETPVAIVKGTISEIYLYNYLTKYYGNDRSRITKDQLNVKPPDVPNAMKSGNSKSAVIWEPFGTLILESDKSAFKDNRSQEIYTHRMYIVCTPEVLKKKKTAIIKFLDAFKQACDICDKNPEKAKEILRNTFPQQESSMNKLWDKVDFSLKYDYDNMKELIFKDAEIMRELEQTPKDKNNVFRKLNKQDLYYYFNNEFKNQINK
jgi:ABC-type nitrate/sulfonate/bicarbonate transport system substrate-binding protein